MSRYLLTKIMNKYYSLGMMLKELEPQVLFSGIFSALRRRLGSTAPFEA